MYSALAAAPAPAAGPAWRPREAQESKLIHFQEATPAVGAQEATGVTRGFGLN